MAKDKEVKEGKVTHICHKCGESFEEKDNPYLCGKCAKADPNFG